MGDAILGKSQLAKLTRFALQPGGVLHKRCPLSKIIPHNMIFSKFHMNSRSCLFTIRAKKKFLKNNFSLILAIIMRSCRIPD